ncbi:hypothetical protein ABIA39_006073 [Nocardia sp. GAS34]|uniref:hypothetical protein n=1 Tax=unclassified Nocardia TaxID=2637762 RepID=UPI003D1B36C4
MMSNHPTDVWNLIAAVVAQVPLTSGKLSDLFHVDISSGSGRRTAGPVRLGSALLIDEIGTASRPDGDWIFSYFDIGAPSSIGLDELKSHYPDVTRTTVPSGHSPEEKFVWTSKEPWGVLNFGFRERDYRLTTVSLHSPGDWNY